MSTEWNRKKLSEWHSGDVVSWIGSMSGFEHECSKFSHITSHAQLSQLSSLCIVSLGIPDEMASLLKYRIQQLNAYGE